MTVPTSGCAWPIDTACFESDWEDLDDATQARSIALAGSTLRRLTGFRVGGCPITVRPCTRACAGGYPSYAEMFSAYGSGSFWPQDFGGVWTNSCGCISDCNCGALCEIYLPGPVGGVTQVKVDGAVISPSKYRVDGNRIVWTDSTPCPFTACQNMALPDSAVGTMSVTYLNSYAVDNLGAYAAGVLAMEYGRACAGGKCRLPSGVTQVARQGVVYEIQAGSFPDGFTGIREVDAFIALWNPGQLRQQSKVWSPDLRRPRVIG